MRFTPAKFYTYYITMRSFPRSGGGNRVSIILIAKRRFGIESRYNTPAAFACESEKSG